MTQESFAFVDAPWSANVLGNPLQFSEIPDMADTNASPDRSAHS